MTAAPTDPPRRGRGRPKGTGTIDPDAIIDAALDALAEGGWNGLTMRGVAREVGVSLASIQHHFATKDVLWRAAVDHLADDVIERRSQLDPTDLTARLTNFVEPGRGRPGLLAALLADHAPGNEERIDYIAARIQAAMADPAARIERWQEAGVLRPFDERALLALVTIGIGSIARSARAVHAICGFDLDTEQGRSELAAGLADLLGSGILAR